MLSILYGNKSMHHAACIGSVTAASHLQVTPAIRGLVPLSHATDAGTLKSVHKRFAPGKTVKFRYAPPV